MFTRKQFTIRPLPLSWKIMRYLAWALKIFLFILLLGFAVKNSDSVTLHYYLGYEWQAPLVLVILLFFTIGTAIGVVASLSFMFKQRRELLMLKKELRIKSHASTLDQIAE